MKSPCGGHTAAPHGALAFCGGLRRTGEGKGGSENRTQGDVGMVLGWFWACFCFSGPTWDRRSFLQAAIMGPWVLARKHNLGPCLVFVFFFRLVCVAFLEKVFAAGSHTLPVLSQNLLVSGRGQCSSFFVWGGPRPQFALLCRGRERKYRRT